MRQIKPSDFLRLAAELIQKDMELAPQIRYGCCGALSSARYKIDQYNEHDEAFEKAFTYLRSLFEPFNPVSWWFGVECDDDQQQHRIISLLLTADMAESVGE